MSYTNKNLADDIIHNNIWNVPANEKDLADKIIHNNLSGLSGNDQILAKEIVHNQLEQIIVSPYLPVDSDCVLYHAYWDGTAIDHSSYRNNGTVNVATFGLLGLEFDGTTGKYVSVPLAPSLQFGASDFAYFFWANLTNNGSSQILFNIFPFSSPSLSGGFMFMAPNFSTGAVFAENNIFPAPSPPGLRYFVSNTPTSITGWRLFGYEIDRNVGAVISIDGVALDVPAGTLYTPSEPNSQLFYIGAQAPAGTGSLDGILGETLWFNAYGTYSGMTREQLYNATKARYGL
jgi:hypothetical protein